MAIDFCQLMSEFQKFPDWRAEFLAENSEKSKIMFILEKYAHTLP